MNHGSIDRHWLITSTTYGTWLPGDSRGLVRMSRTSLKRPPIYFELVQSQEIFDRFTETASCRRWLLCAVGVMTNHFHIVMGVPGDPDPDDILEDFKSYASREPRRGDIRCSD